MQAGPPLTMDQELAGRLDALTSSQRARADRLLDIRIVAGRTDPPPDLEEWSVNDLR